MPQQSAFPSLSPPRPYRPGPGADAAGPGAVPALWVAASEPVPSPGPARSAPAQSGGVFVTGAGELKAAIERWPALPGRTVVALRGELTPPAAANLLTAIRHAIRVGGRLLLIQAGAGGTSMVQTLRREERALDCLSIEIEPTPAAVAAARTFASAPGNGRAELSVDRRGAAGVTRWVQVPVPAGAPPFAPGDGVVVTGGLGGLGRAVALHLSRRLGIHPVLLDCAAPGDPGTERALAQVRAAGLPFTHVVADVTDPAAVRAALRPVLATRTIRGLVHCAGLVEGGRARTLAVADVMRLSAPKVAGLRSVLDALDPRQLRVVLGFGSILARQPHPGVGAYALANELLRREVDRRARLSPGPRYLTAEWSIWDGAGVAAESGAVAVARQTGYQPIPLAAGLHLVERLLAWTDPATSVVVSASPPRAVPARGAGHDPPQ